MIKQALLALLLLSASFAPAAAEKPSGDNAVPKIVALGDSLTAGYGLAPQEAYPARLQDALLARGYEVEIVNAGVSGDTSAGGLTRLEWSVPEGTAGVILALGANDMLRGIEPEKTREALAEILATLRKRGIPVILVGMRAAPNLGEDYVTRFDAVYPTLAAQYEVPLVPFFLEGVAADPKLNQADGLHPTAKGVDVMVQNSLEEIIKFLARAGIAPKEGE